MSQYLTGEWLDSWNKQHLDKTEKKFHNGSKMEPKRGNMVTLTIKNVPETIYERIKIQAKNNHRSINGEIISLLEHALSIPPIDVEGTIKRARKIRELTADYVISADEIEKMIDEGRE
jgi:antitoxin FitA